MADIFSRTTELGGTMSADATRMTFAEMDGAGLILQQVQMAYEQTVSRLFALESGKIYFVAGQTNGNLNAQHVIGPAGIQKDFYASYGDLCNIGGQFVVTANAGCGDQALSTSSVVLAMPLISRVELQAQAQNMIIFSSFAATFTEMRFK